MGEKRFEEPKKGGRNKCVTWRQSCDPIGLFFVAGSTPKRTPRAPMLAALETMAPMLAALTETGMVSAHAVEICRHEFFFLFSDIACVELLIVVIVHDNLHCRIGYNGIKTKEKGNKRSGQTL